MQTERQTDSLDSMTGSTERSSAFLPVFLFPVYVYSVQRKLSPYCKRAAGEQRGGAVLGRGQVRAWFTPLLGSS